MAVTLFRLGIENNNDGRSIAWALEHPGCFAYGVDQPEAESNFPHAAMEYAAWVAGRGGDWLSAGQPVRFAQEETFDVYFVDDAFERTEPGRGSSVESFFGYDWKPLTALDIERALKLLAWTRADLDQVIRGLSTADLIREHAGELWSIGGILKHVAVAEWWYQERIGSPFPEREDDLPPDPLECLRLVRRHFEALLPDLQGVNNVIGWKGELWSPRKVLRRAVWHERDHTDHIRKLI